MESFGNFVENVVETPICCELKQHLDKLYEIYIKDYKKCMFYLQPLMRESAKSNSFRILLPSLLEKYYVKKEIKNDSREID